MSPTVAPKSKTETGSGRAFRDFWVKLKVHWQEPRFRWFALGAAAILLVATVGVALFFAPRESGSKYLEIYVTDFPADFEKFQLSVSGVYVGQEAYELQVDAKEFDILQYHGTGNSLLLAYGEVPSGKLDRLSVVFTRAQASFAGQWIPIPIPKKMLTITDGIHLGDDKDGALLLDIEMEKSLVLSEKGYTFEPYVKNLWEHSFVGDAPPPSEPAGRGTLAKNGFTAPPVVDPGQKREDPPPPRQQGGPSAPAAPPSSSAPACEAECDGAGGESGPSSPTPPSDRILPAQDQALSGGQSLGQGGCDADFENPNLQHAESWAQHHLEREACALADLTAYYYERADENLTYVAKVVQNKGPIYVDHLADTRLQTNIQSYQAVPIVGDILNNLPDVSVILDPVTGALLSQDEIQSAASDIVRLGGQPLFAFSMAPAIAFQATPQKAWDISQSPYVEWVELAVEGAAIEFDSLATANINAQVTPVRTLTAPDGHPYDGHDVGVAIIDSGVDGLHRDLPYDNTGLRPASAAILENCVLVPPKNTFGLGAVPLLDQSSLCVSAAHTDANGHGTMAAGVLLGRAPAADAQSATLLSPANLVGYDVWTNLGNWVYGPSDAPQNLNQRGVAPGAKGYAISLTGDGANLLMASLAYDRLLWMLDHPKPGDPRILVVSNSWETWWQSTNENSLLYWQMNEVINRGVTIVFSAGNGGGDGITPMTSPECVHPREGVVCVGAIEDNDQSNRSRVNVWFASSRGNRFDPLTWPDLCAPGTRIRTTFPTAYSPDTLAGFLMGGGVTSPYALFTGTSASAPYVAGVVAILQQARHDAGKAYLSPDAVEYVLEQSAFAFPNVQGGYALSNDDRFNGSNYECGHGLVDAKLAIEWALAQP